jgi:ATP-dependent DNA helicase RecG
MRPALLNPLFAAVTTLPGIGPRLGKALETLCGGKVADLLWHLPTGLIDRRFSPRLADAPDGAVCTLAVTVGAHAPPRAARQPYRVRCFDETGEIELVFFHAHADYLTKTLPEGAERVISGRVEHYRGRIQMTHPDHMVSPEEAATLPAVEPVYLMTAGLTPRPLHRAIQAALERAPDVAEWQDAAWLKKQGWAGWRTALLAAHAPDSAAALEDDAPARQRLAFDELLADQLALAIVRAQQRKLLGRSFKGDGRLAKRALAALPFTLTGSQQTALAEIGADMASEHRMLRLLQGDVGSGKTVVAFMAALQAIEAGGQAAIMAPTEVLARQHFATIAPLAEAVGLGCALLTGRDKGKARAAILDGFASGETAIAIGTHALFQDDIAFHNLALAVIDEQHRFGVHQRLALSAKGRGADMLVMTATPIPRTLTLACYSDLDVSRLTDKPAGRQPIQTSAVPLDRLEQVVERLGKAIAGGARVFWVCPLVEDSDTLDVAAATARHAHLEQRFPGRVGLVHGRMKPTEKDKAMAAFAEGRTDILVATTVIEVGVDVPEATIMVVEHAERFGLAQLHQLRGRVGRGAAASSCLLLYAPPLTQGARARLDILRKTEDGFLIAEEDLKLRGAGELLGTRQSGLPVFRIADIVAQQELMLAARDDAKLILQRDPDLAGERGRALRVLLYLFEKDAVVQTLRSG